MADFISPTAAIMLREMVKDPAVKHYGDGLADLLRRPIGHCSADPRQAAQVRVARQGREARRQSAEAAHLLQAHRQRLALR
jgi:hypothetical protein